jgi:hypothetical protein
MDISVSHVISLDLACAQPQKFVISKLQPTGELFSIS